MGRHKFLVLVGDSYHLEDYDLDPQLSKQIYWNEEYFMHVVTCHHERFEDNIVTFLLKNSYDGVMDEVGLLRDVNGRLWYVDQYMTKMDLIKEFENTSDTEHVPASDPAPKVHEQNQGLDERLMALYSLKNMVTDEKERAEIQAYIDRRLEELNRDS